jgi:hypothetical protein
VEPAAKTSPLTAALIFIALAAVRTPPSTGHWLLLYHRSRKGRAPLECRSQRNRSASSRSASRSTVSSLFNGSSSEDEPPTVSKSWSVAGLGPRDLEYLLPEPLARCELSAWSDPWCNMIVHVRGSQGHSSCACGPLLPPSR